MQQILSKNLFWLIAFILILSSCSKPILPEAKEKEPEPPITTKLSIEGSTSWLANAIGSSPIEAKLIYNNDYFKREFKIDLKAGKSSTDYSSDNLLFISKNSDNLITGSGEIIARIAKVSADTSSVAVMMRESLHTTSKFAYIAVQNGNKLSFSLKNKSAEPAFDVATASIELPIWLKLKRSDDDYSAFYSKDGIAWIQLGQKENIEMKAKIMAGIALLPLANSQYEAVVDNILLHSKFYYISPSGNDNNSGAYNSPWKTFDYAIAKLYPGDVLVLKDGVYKDSSTGVLEISEYTKAKNGSEAAPITIMAEHERKALIDGEGKNFPVYIEERSNWIIDGLAARNTDLAGEKHHKGHVFFVKGSKTDIGKTSSILLKRVLAFWPNRYGNNHGILVNYSQDIAIEDAEVYSFHRHGIDAYGSNRVVIRRAYINSNNQEDRAGASSRSNGESLLTNGGDEAIALYGSSNSIVENSIAENRQTGFVVNGGIWPSSSTTSNRFVAQNNLFAGNINYKAVIGAGVNSREYYSHLFQTTGNRFENLLVINPESGEYDSGRALNIFSVPELELANITVYTNYDGYANTPKIKGFLARERSDIKCEELSVSGGKCSFALANSLIWSEGKQNSHSQAFSLTSKPSENIIEYNNIYGFADNNGVGENMNDSSGEFKYNIQQAPTGFAKYNTDVKRFLVWVSDNSNMKNAGQDGNDIGANIRKRYYNGVLTDEDLWTDAEFPCGVEIPNSLISNSDIYPLGKCSTIAERLHVTGP